MPVYNAERYIRPCLDSILSQKTNYNYRVICVDDGSPDQCGRILDEEYADRPNVLVIHQENRGHSGARNRALNELDSRYLSFVDSDDRLPDCNVFDALLTFCNKMDYGLVGGGRLSENSWGTIELMYNLLSLLNQSVNLALCTLFLHTE